MTKHGVVERDHDDDIDNIVKVGGKSDSKGVASYVALALDHHEEVEVRAIGRDAVYVAVRALVVLAGEMAQYGREPVIRVRHYRAEAREGGEMRGVVFLVEAMDI